MKTIHEFVLFQIFDDIEGIISCKHRDNWIQTDRQMKTLKIIEVGPQVNQMTVIANHDQLFKIKHGQISKV